MSFELNAQNCKTLCPLAWMHSFVNNDGSVQLCCTSEEYDNVIRTDDGKKISIVDEKSPAEILNTKFMRDIRLQMLSGKWPDVCRRCQITEAQSGASRRSVEFNAHRGEMPRLIAETGESGETSAKITSADYRVGNVCNLQCRMCNPRASRTWINDWNKLRPDYEQTTAERLETFREYTWIDSPSFVSDLRAKVQDLDHLHFAGGEPLLAPQMLKLLQQCVDAGTSGKITLSYNTNGTRFPASVLEIWKKFKAVKLLVSVDGVGKLNEYIRYPSKWAEVAENLTLIDQRHAEFNISECIVSTTVQANNVLHLGELIDYLSHFKFIIPLPNLITLHFPVYSQLGVLPKKLRLQAMLSLMAIADESEKKLSAEYAYLQDNLQQVIRALSATHPEQEKLFKIFKDFTVRYDTAKGLSVDDVCPEFAEFW